MSRFDAGVTFLPMSDLVPFGDRSYHGLDLIHPSVKGSRGIGQRIAALIGKSI
jgi:acyl-CoA thioesterase I